jgi:hypothetical protein
LVPIRDFTLKSAVVFFAVRSTDSASVNLRRTVNLRIVI